MAPNESDLQQLSDWCGRVDQEAAERARNWYRHPSFVPFDGYGGLSLGDLVEYEVLKIVLRAVMETRPHA